jgi:predicted HTH transcriptional regulator
MPGLTRIFISSVQREFAAERRALKDYIEGDPLLSRFFDVFLFEDLPAGDRRADDVYLAEVDRCAIFIGLLGFDYGSEDATGVSPTEHEFNRATALAKPRLIYLRDEASAAGRHPKMAALIRRAEGQLVRRRFHDVAELTAAVYASLIEHLSSAGLLRLLPFDAAPCHGATAADLAGDRLDLFLGRAQAIRGYALGSGTPLPAALAHLNLVENNTPTHAAMLLFGREPQRWLPTSAVKCLHFHGTVVQKPIPSHQVYRGDVFQLVDQSVDFVMSKLARAVGTRAESAAVPVTYEIPREAVTEAIVNAVAHRDYTSNASVQVMLFSDRLEVWNPGELPPSLSPDRLTRPHASIPRNPLLAEPLFLAGYIEQAGTGTLDMIARARDAGLRPPEFRQDGGSFVQTLWRPVDLTTLQVTPQATSQVTPQVNPARAKHLGELAVALGIDTPQVAPQVITQAAKLLEAAMTPLSREELQQHVGLADRKHFREVLLNPFLAAGWLEMTIPDVPQSRLQKYRLTEKGRAWLNARH